LLGLSHIFFVTFCALGAKISAALARVVDPDWIRIGSGFNDFVDPGLDSESGSMGKKNEEKNALFKHFYSLR
jgi:hypothetical protein